PCSMITPSQHPLPPSTYTPSLHDALPILIHDDLHMSETQIGLLMGMPLAMFALAAVPGSLLIARIGVLTAATAGLAIATLAAGADRKSVAQGKRSRAGGRAERGGDQETTV